MDNRNTGGDSEYSEWMQKLEDMETETVQKEKEMTLREKQSTFLFNVAKLIFWAFDNGYELTGGELLRTKDQQYLYFEGYKLDRIGGVLKLFKINSLSKTMNSKHLDKLAIDLNLFVDGEYKSDAESHRPLGEYWKSLNPDNVWGGDWGWDGNHYEMKP